MSGFADENDDGGKVYSEHLRMANSLDLSDVESRGCVSQGTDERGLPIMIFIPRIGFGFQDKTEESIRRMLLLFIRKADDVVRNPYSIVYSHTNIHWLNQQPVVYEYYKMLPRKYKKNLQKIFILHPQVGIRVFFEFSRVFLSQKFYSKLHFVETVAEFQRSIPANRLLLPYSFLAAEDDDRGLKGSGVIPPLQLTFDEAVGTTRLLAKCTSYIRSHGGLQQQGLFRVAGDEVQMSILRNRLQPPVSATPEQKRAFMSHVLIGTDDMLPPAYLQPTSRNSKRSSMKVTPAMELDIAIENLSTVVLTDINTIAQTIKLLLRDLETPLFTYESYDPLMALTKQLESGKVSLEQWYERVFAIIGTMPRCHASTLAYLLDFLREVDNFSELNSMDCSNLAIVFAPTLLRPREMNYSDPMKAFNEVRIAQVILTKLLVQDPSERVVGANTLARSSLSSLEKSMDRIGFDSSRRPSFGNNSVASDGSGGGGTGGGGGSKKNSSRRTSLPKGSKGRSVRVTGDGVPHPLGNSEGIASSASISEEVISAGLSPTMIKRLTHSSSRRFEEKNSQSVGVESAVDHHSKQPQQEEEEVSEEWRLLEEEAAREAERIKKEVSEGWTPVVRKSRRWSLNRQSVK